MADLSDLPHKAPSPASRPKWKRYYVKGDIVPFEEDATHEFKGHRNLSVEDVPPWAVGPNNKRTRRAVSRTLNGFLNTGKGGTVYLGITDEGHVRGLNLTQYIKDHMVVAVDDLMSRYTPPVASHRYKIRFIPVVQRDATEEQIETLCNYDSSIHIDPDVRLKPHILRMSNYCWCDRDHIARINSRRQYPIAHYL
ncbi:uncharacterized protein LOC106179420 [Lingula anatina]|uniref:Uncharacterized protein LOC106179420 n=1 Tax=Lingula anatina TaxID=7574 RepID=A0A1S3K788_LINAN|nr:uncharacterized protein LOC106179420 [Lingula anatina]|eukprot:XP_013418493.1 uncharacterized protein LOC106179420 [Lingula anatina]